MARLKPKKKGYGLDFKSFQGKKSLYLVFRTPDGAFHVFAEVEAKAAARDCGDKSPGNTRQNWERLWDQQESN